jgi:hypothetical protein
MPARFPAPLPFRIPLIGPVAQSAWHAARPILLRLATPHVARRYCRTNGVRKLQLGASFPGLPGWLNTDLYPPRWPIVRLDATRRFPFADGTFHFVFAEHMIEHVPLRGARAMLAESFRVLDRGGWIRLATPDLARVVRLYLEPDVPAHQRYFARSVDAFALDRSLPPRAVTINSLFYLHGHRFLFDEPALARLLLEAGLVEVRRCQPGESELPELHDIERHQNVIGAEANILETLVLEAQKP